MKNVFLPLAFLAISLGTFACTPNEGTVESTGVDDQTGRAFICDDGDTENDDCPTGADADQRGTQRINSNN